MSTIRVGIVGLARAGCDTDTVHRKRFADKCGCPLYGCIEDLIADPNGDLVDIASRAKSGFPRPGFGSPDTFKWRGQTLPVASKSGSTMPFIWDPLHASIREGIPFPITLDEALGVMMVVSAARKGTALEEGMVG